MTCGGSIIIARTSSSAALRPRQRSRASAYATGTLEITTPTVDRPAYRNVFSA